MNIIFMVIVQMLGMLTTTTPTRPVVYVQSSLTGTYNKALHTAVNFDGKYTHSRLIIGKCHAGKVCITVRANGLPSVAHGTVLGATWNPGTRNPLVRINTRYHDSQHEKAEVIAHELGHALGIVNHNPRCTSLMHANMNCHGHLPPMTFTAGERRILGRA